MSTARDARSLRTRRVDDATFGVRVDFERGSQDPGRVFRAMARILESLESIDRSLVAVIDTGIQAELLLEDVESGSITSWLRNRVTSGSASTASLQPDALQSLQRYLVSGKGTIFRFAEERDTIRSRAEVLTLREELNSLAQQVHGWGQLAIHPMQERTVISDLSKLSDSIAQLDRGDRVSFITRGNVISVNPGFRVTEEAVDQLLTRERIVHESTMILKIKRPDYLGDSRWEFRHQDHTIDAKMSDMNWLSRFRARAVSLRSGDALKALVRSELYYGYDGDVLKARHEVLQVEDVLVAESWEQASLVMTPGHVGF